MENRMKIENFQSQVCVCAASTNLTCAKGRAEMGLSMEKTVFVNSSDCKKLFTKKEIFVFGTGADAEQVEKELGGYSDILAYIDNRRYGKGHCFHGKSIINMEQYIKQRGKGQPVIIATYRFAMEIHAQMVDAGLIPGTDFYIWDDLCLFHYDENIKAYIEFTKNIWERSKEVHKNIILIPFDNQHDLLPVICAYFANYYAVKFDASIYAYLRMGSAYSNASEVCKDIYKAFNVEHFIDPALSKEQQTEADEIFNSVWERLHTWEDWKNIHIYGICFGTTIIRDLLRFHIPGLDLRDEKMQLFLRKTVNTIVFWHHYIFENDFKVVFLADGVSWDGYIRDIAITKGIPTYILSDNLKKASLGFYPGTPYLYFDKMWNQLTREEQEYGVKWAREHIEKRIHGNTDEVLCADKNNFAFAEGKKDFHVLETNEKIKIVICPHIFEEDCFFCGEQIFDNNYFAWLCHLGELSEKTPDYDWYLKMHPTSQQRDFIIIDLLLEKYPNIKKIPFHISPMQLKEEGIDYALTVYGSIGHEYPYIGIQVINAGNNPHSAFGFTWNPKTKEEYDDLILNLGHLDKKVDMEGLYRFYCLNYLYYDWTYIHHRELFFKNPVLSLYRKDLEAVGKTSGTWRYKEYMEEWTVERHERILQELSDIFKRLDDWRPDVLYKNMYEIPVKGDMDS